MPELTTAVVAWRSDLLVMRAAPSVGAGCPDCLRWFLHRQQVPGSRASDTRDLDGTVGGPEAPETDDPALAALLDAVTDELETRPEGSVAVVRRRPLGVRWALVPPATACGHTGQASSGRLSATVDEARLAIAGDGLRGGAGPAPDLESAYVGATTMFTPARLDIDGPVPAVQVGVPLPDGGEEPGIGRTEDFASSRRVAVLEGLERFAALQGAAGTAATVASLSELGEAALDPALLGAPAPEQYAAGAYAPLAPDEQVRWLPLTPLGRGSRRWVPEMAVAWNAVPAGRKPLFYDTSNGFALGSTPEEAALHGVLEVVERDAFLRTWHQRLALPELEIETGEDDLAVLVDRYEVVTGFRVRLLWAAMEEGVPVVVALAGRDAETGPATFVSAGASLSPRAAARSAVLEVAAISMAVTHGFADDLPHAASLAEDHNRVRTMHDHSLLGALASSRPWYDFLTGEDRERVDLAALEARRPRHPTVTAALEDLVGRLEDHGSEVYATEVTTAELEWRGLSCVRSFVPGFLPMTFGHDQRRLHGLPRLHEPVPGLRSRLSGRTPEDQPPHPFP
ncbi:hypothetical protein GCM10011519_29790 [Marmoricola endophyticus]|uniref:YcaO domain-containing protein n=1 Tax=Marmoricola endophyticus TaxID=2040280 RepID=A0A917BP95_9ACTN|nr:YcaO-like family protein [Marmoricola endophyticus]GGF53935.1 hypothetical protein GCM10011519_29790 [Marmoricola endophyticus]